MAIEALTGVGATAAPGSLTPAIEVSLTGVAASARHGLMVNSESPGESFTLVVPLPALALTGVTGTTATMALDAPLPALAMTGEVPVDGALTLSLPPPRFALTGVAGTTGTLTLQLLLPTLVMGDAGALTLELPLPTLAMTGAAGATGQLTLRPPLPTLALSGYAENVGTLALRPRLPRLVMDAQAGTVGTLSLTPPKPALVLRGAVGTDGTLTLTAPLPGLVLTGNYAAIGAMTLAAPAIRLVMTGDSQGTTAQVGASRLTYALQTERMALTKYTNFPFNSFAVFQGRYLGASADGIFELVGDTDAGVPIAAAARFGITDMNTSRVKRVDRVYVGYRTNVGSALLLRVTTNETQQRDYAVPPARTGGLHGAHTTLGKGVEARYWQFELQNRYGADFSIDTLEVRPIPLRRRIGAKDA